MGIEHLSTGRVLVVDDQPEEAVPILTALAEVGVGAVYVRGDKVEELPRQPIDGIRLVFLDMRLDEGGDQKSVLSKTLGVLQQCVPASPMPILVVCWTKHSEAAMPSISSIRGDSRSRSTADGLPLSSAVWLRSPCWSLFTSWGRSSRLWTPKSINDGSM